VDKLIESQWAANLLADDMFIKVMDDLKNSQISAIINTNQDDIDSREKAYQFIKTLDLIKGHLSGLAAEKQIQAKRFKIL
jgi:hypothetical protein